MAVNLYRATVERFDQTLGALEGYLAKGLAHCESSGCDPQEAVDHRLIDDMLPLHFQVVSSTHHSLGAIKGVEAGEFNPPPKLQLDYAGLQQLVSDARSGLAGYSEEQINDLAERDITFRAGERTMPFIGADFLLSFSIPNFYFHATTAYDILRARGVELTKRDFLGRMLLKQ